MSVKKLPIYAAAERNKEPILSILTQYIPQNVKQVLLEISSGCGQHAAHFAANLPDLTFYPSEYDEKLLNIIKETTADYSNVKPPSLVDVSTDFKSWNNDVFKENNFDYIYNANLIHISPIKCTYGLFKNAGKLLKPNGILFTYGAYAVDGVLVPDSNVQFDKMLRSQNPEWGVRDIRDLKKIASENGIFFEKMFDMPANNKTIIWRKHGTNDKNDK